MAAIPLVGMQRVAASAIPHRRHGADVIAVAVARHMVVGGTCGDSVLVGSERRGMVRDAWGRDVFLRCHGWGGDDDGGRPVGDNDGGMKRVDEKEQ